MAVPSLQGRWEHEVRQSHPVSVTNKMCDLEQDGCASLSCFLFSNMWVMIHTPADCWEN